MPMSQKVQIYIRSRNEESSIWSNKNNSLCYELDGKEYHIDGFTEIYIKENNQQIFDGAIKNLIQEFNIHHKNFTIFAYGQTGSGKSYTMTGSFSQNIPGIIQLSLETLDYSDCTMSYFEIYNEKIYDLYLTKELKIYETDNKNQIKDLHIEKVNSKDEAMNFLSICIGNRKTAETIKNKSSSRSHSILQITSHNATLNFIDLAGSEKANDDKKRLTEGNFINKSLLALATLVANLIKEAPVGFRNSKLTRIIQNSVEDDAQMIGLFMLNPYKEQFSESISSLNFACRMMNVDFTKAKKIKNDDNESTTEIIQEYEVENSSKLIEIYRDRIEALEYLVEVYMEEALDAKAKKIYGIEKQLFNLKIQGSRPRTEKNL
ncbi:hypothetical protein NUSPORA_00098 [Nucleospora cyclopteri]